MAPVGRFGRVLTAMVTPFDADGGLDLDARPRPGPLAGGARQRRAGRGRHHRRGADARDDEKLSLWAAVAEAVTIPVIAGTGTNDTAHSVAPHPRGLQARASPASSRSARTTTGRRRPGSRPTSGPSPAATDLPVMIYDIPIRTGRKIATATLLRLAREVPNVLALKDAAGNPGETAALVSSAPEGFEVYSGDDAMTLPLLASGAVGVIGVATHWTGSGPPGPHRSVGEGRRGRRPPRERPPPGELRLRDRRRRSEPAPHQGACCECSTSRSGRPGCRWGRRRLGSRTGPARCWPTSSVARGLPRPSRPPVGLIAPCRSPSASRSSVAWARSVATAWCSSRTIGSCSSTAASCSPTPTCTASTSSCPTSPTCATTPIGSSAASPPTATRTTSAGCRFLLRELSFPIYGSALTLGLARNRIEEAGLLGRTELIAVADGERRRIGPFDVEFIPVTHSVPHGFAIAFHTPQGVDPALGRLQARPHAGRRPADRPGPHRRHRRRPGGIRLLLSDSTNAEEHGHAPSERAVGAVLRALFAEHGGRRIITASFASHIHRIQQIADAAIAAGRVVATLGMSMKKNVRLARDLGLLPIPDASLHRHRGRRSTAARRGVRHLHRLAGRADVGAGADGRRREPLAQDRRARHGDPVAATPSPATSSTSTGSSTGCCASAPRSCTRGVADVHATGHAQADELKTLLSIARPELFVPVHGEYRHLAAHAQLAAVMGVADRPHPRCARTATSSR